LRRGPIRDASQLEDLFQELCLALLKDGGRRLAQFDESRGSLAYFLQMQLQQLFHRWLRTQRRSHLEFSAETTEQSYELPELSAEFFATELSKLLPAAQ